MNKESFLYVVVFTFVTAFVFVFVIALADGATAERVERNRELVTAQAFLGAAGFPLSGTVADLDSYKNAFDQADEDGITTAQIEGRSILAREFTGQGLWGTVTGVLAVDSAVSRIIGLDIISHSETPGLGGRIEEDWFKNQFRNEAIGSDGIRVLKGEGGIDSNPDNGIVDGVTGASLTSAAMEVMINNEIARFKEAVQ